MPKKDNNKKELSLLSMMLLKDGKNLRDQVEMYKRILDTVRNGIVVTDPDGMVVFFNKPYGEFLGINPDDALGKHVTKVIENTRMHIVAKTGASEINVAQRIRGQDMVVQRIPIMQDDKVVAVFGHVMFKDVQDISKLARELHLLESKVQLYEEELKTLRSTRYTFDSIVTVSRSLEVLKKTAQKAALSHLPVLITGESGTGKEVFAQAIHNASTRSTRPFIRINCSAIPKDLMESELFGYEKGAFTGAYAGGKPGKFELAHQGSIFLDEIGDLPLELQPKLLRILEEKEFERVGGKTYVSSDFRLIAASNQKLEEMVEMGKLRKDLFYRLNVIRIDIPPLRERKEDILPVAHYILQRMCKESSLPEVKIDTLAEQALMDYDWPGNVRELHNVLGRALSILEGDTIHFLDLLLHLQVKQKAASESGTAYLKDTMSCTEQEALIKALSTANNNKGRAAELLGIHRTLLYKKMKKYGLL
jgi:transcriptional regulator with PAS, ATPase and Fis domain